MAETMRGLERGLMVLRTLQDAAALSLADSHRSTSLPKPSLLRVLATLQAHGMVSRSVGDGLYRFRSSGAPRVPQRHQRLAEAAGPHLVRLQEKVLWPSDLAVRRGRQMEIIETNRGLSGLQLARDRLGDRVEMSGTAMGRAYLAFCPAPERERLIAELRRHDRGPMGPLDLPRLEAAIRQARTRGYAVRDPQQSGWQRLGRGDDGLDAIAVPILDGNTVPGCLNLLWPRRFRLVGEIARLHLEDLQATARAIAQDARQGRTAAPRGEAAAHAA